MNGVISNGRAPRTLSTVGSVVSVNCTWQLGHHEITCPDLLRASLSIVLSAIVVGVFAYPVMVLLTVTHTVVGALLFAFSVLVVLVCYRIVPRGRAAEAPAQHQVTV